MRSPPGLGEKAARLVVIKGCYNGFTSYNQNPVNEQIAQRLVTAELERLRLLSYSQLVQRIGKPETAQITGEDGRPYQLEAQAFWDRGKGGDVRVMVAADEGGWRAFKPLTGDFIMRPDGSFVDE